MHTHMHIMLAMDMVFKLIEAGLYCYYCHLLSFDVRLIALACTTIQATKFCSSFAWFYCSASTAYLQTKLGGPGCLQILFHNSMIHHFTQ